MHVLVVREDSLGLGTKEVVVPKTNESHQDGNVLLKRSVDKVLIHFMATTEEILKVLVANGDGNGKTDSRPERVTATNPIPELEHVLSINAKLGDQFSVGGQGNKVLSDMAGL